MAETFAIGDLESKRVDLWCKALGRTRHPERGAPFYVINGDWNGWLNDDGVMHIDAPRGVRRYDRTVAILWRGEAPFTEYDYNEAIIWIEGQL